MPRNPLRAWLHTFAPATAALLFAVPVFALAQTPTPAPQNAPAAPPQQSAPSTAGQQPTPPAAGQQATPTPGSDEGEFTIRRSVDEVNLIFTVTDKHSGRFVSDLQQQ